MPITIIFHGPDGEKTYDEKEVASGKQGVFGNLTSGDIEKGWKSLVANNLPALKWACENPHPYVPD